LELSFDFLNKINESETKKEKNKLKKEKERKNHQKK
jgi:hypothetical protein